ncbi:MAG: prepilin-type N-terminal cleavage/methylation domain-containing protein [Dehalococcoidia bacterium]|nr:prepilin-type N-terminal cleavage/methylation domain-containing protein [Dehalococcoidia bacterium]
MNQKGQTLIEVVIGIALIALVMTSFFTALNTSLTATTIVNKRTTAESLTRTELEYIKNHAYVYWVTSAPPDYGNATARIPDVFRDQYTMTLIVVPIDPVTHVPLTIPPDSDQGMQLITVSVYFHDEPVLTTESYKVDR